MLEALRNAWRLPDVRNKLLLTGLILVIYQFAAHVPVVGVDRDALEQLLSPNAVGGGFCRSVEPAFWRGGGELQHYGDGRLPLHHRVHYLPVARADHPTPARDPKGTGRSG